MQHSVSVVYTYCVEDSLRIAHFIRNRSFVYRNDVWLTGGIVFLAFVVLIFLLSERFSEINPLGTFVFSAIPAVAVAVIVYFLHKSINPWLMRRRIRKYFDSSSTAGNETVLEFSIDGIKTESELTSSFSKWDSFVKIVETNSDIIFFGSSEPNGFIPKVAFETEDDLASVKFMITNVIGSRAQLL